MTADVWWGRSSKVRADNYFTLRVFPGICRGNTEFVPGIDLLYFGGGTRCGAAKSRNSGRFIRVSLFPARDAGETSLYLPPADEPRGTGSLRALCAPITGPGAHRGTASAVRGALDRAGVFAKSNRNQERTLHMGKLS